MEDANETVHTNAKFKDRLFRIVFGAEENKRHLLSLYNALNGTDFGESEMVEITTLDDAIYIRMKNDISFILPVFLRKTPMRHETIAPAFRYLIYFPSDIITL